MSDTKPRDYQVTLLASEYDALVAENEGLKEALERIDRELRRQRFTLAAMPAYMVREIQEWAEAALTPKAST